MWDKKGDEKEGKKQQQSLTGKFWVSISCFTAALSEPHKHLFADWFRKCLKKCYWFSIKTFVFAI